MSHTILTWKLLILRKQKGVTVEIASAAGFLGEGGDRVDTPRNLSPGRDVVGGGLLGFEAAEPEWKRRDRGRQRGSPKRKQRRGARWKGFS